MFSSIINSRLLVYGNAKKDSKRDNYVIIVKVKVLRGVEQSIYTEKVIGQRGILVKLVPLFDYGYSVVRH